MRIRQKSGWGRGKNVQSWGMGTNIFWSPSSKNSTKFGKRPFCPPPIYTCINQCIPFISFVSLFLCTRYVFNVSHSFNNANGVKREREREGEIERENERETERQREREKERQREKRD